MILDLLFAILQIPLAFTLAVKSARVRKSVTGRTRDILLLVISCSACMIAWRLATLSQLVDPQYRPVGGMAVQTLFIVVVILLVSDTGKHSGQHNS